MLAYHLTVSPRLRGALTLALTVRTLTSCVPDAPNAASAQEHELSAKTDTSPKSAAETVSEEPKDATDITERANEAVARQLQFGDRRDFQDAKRGFIATLPALDIKNAAGQRVFSLQPYEFLKSKDRPATVNPSLWRIAQLNLNHGLFKVTHRIYQIRGFDISNMTIVEGDHGLIVIDPLISPETAKAGLDLYYRHRPRRPVRTVIYTHSHVDHYGGVKGIVSEDAVKAGKVAILAPEGFLQAAVSENVYAGTAMGRRALYMYGTLLPRGARGQVDVGLGKAVSTSPPTLIAPTDLITHTGERRHLDGLDLVFQMAPDTEAPAEMLFYFPQLRALCAAEDATHNLHNLYTLRGAQVRDAKQWWKTLNQTLEMFGDKVEVVFASHHWPTWGNTSVRALLSDQRDMYKHLHDQTLRMLNHGLTSAEIAEQLRLPAKLASKWYNRGYYGSVSHDAKGIYQRYLGWYDSHPATLNSLPREQAAKRYVDFMGGADNVLARSRDAFQQGDYRWVAEVLTHVVFADPDNSAARHLQADAFEQLGYQSENATWRNEYLSAAQELRKGVPKDLPMVVSADSVAAMTTDMLLDFMGMRLDAPTVEQQNATYQWTFTDRGEQYAATLQNGVLTYTADKRLPHADVSVIGPRASVEGILFGKTTLDAEQKAGRLQVRGDAKALEGLLAALDRFEPGFNIVTP